MFVGEYKITIKYYIEVRIIFTTIFHYYCVEKRSRLLTIIVLTKTHKNGVKYNDVRTNIKYGANQ